MMIQFKSILQESKLEVRVDTNASFYHGTNVDKLTQFELGHDARYTAFMGATKQYKSNMIFFSPSKETANYFAKNRADYFDQYPHVYEVALQASRTLDCRYKTQTLVDFLGKSGLDFKQWFGIHHGYQDYVEPSKIPASWYNFTAAELNVDLAANHPDVVENIKKSGFDSILFGEGDKVQLKGQWSIAVFDPSQAKIIRQLS